MKKYSSLIGCVIRIAGQLVSLFISAVLASDSTGVVGICILYGSACFFATLLEVENYSEVTKITILIVILQIIFSIVSGYILVFYRNFFAHTFCAGVLLLGTFTALAQLQDE